MANAPKKNTRENARSKKSRSTGRQAAAKMQVGEGGEPHQTTTGEVLTSNQGVPIADHQNTLTVGPRGPQLIEDSFMREKITHFDHERIPERAVHARGYAAHGYFEAYGKNAPLTKAAFLQPGVKTDVFVRFSTVAGSKGSPDTARDVRGFAVKFYTTEGNYDLVGNNIPVFFIQDAIKFPDLIHSVKPAPDRGFPQAQSAHDSFWDFVSLTPESVNMLMWVMSDRAIPRSFRMMDGFGVHTFRLINKSGKSTFVKFHWRPKLGAVSLIWDEALAIAGADPDFHRRDLWNAIEDGDYPEWELSVQAFSEEEADAFDFDVLDPTKLVPEELVPLRPLGKMVLNRNVDNFFAETEQVAFCPSHVVPGIDLSNDPLLQGRLFSYLDTQLSRLGSPNFHQIPVNKPRCPVGNFQRDGHMQTGAQATRVAYEPNSLDDGGPREDPKRGFQSYPAEEFGQKLRIRPESFADHYTQARQFWHSMTEPEQRHIIGGFSFELGKVQRQEIRERMVGHLMVVDPDLAKSVAEKLGLEGKIRPARPAVEPRDIEPSPALSQYRAVKGDLGGKKVGVLVTDGAPSRLFRALKKAVKAAGGQLATVAVRPAPVALDDGTSLEVDHFLAGAPSAVFDAVVLIPGPDEVEELLSLSASVDWVRDAFAHLKVIGYTPEIVTILERANIERFAAEDDGLVELSNKAVKTFVEEASQHRCWDREPAVR
ncbi:Catalase C [Planctomycetes bacterium Poly30]|uniref:Catalase n=1 Tax=Saltatorellus ferox TaxID=2528018 RepID=A0A518EV87_9BACT|nr:Catalase C [Planctomycetes bacterium Poly30]